MGIGPLGLPELFLIFVVALLVFGPRKLPEIGRTIGQALAMFRKASTEFQNSIKHELQVEDLKKFKLDSPYGTSETPAVDEEPGRPRQRDPGRPPEPVEAPTDTPRPDAGEPASAPEQGREGPEKG